MVVFLLETRPVGNPELTEQFSFDLSENWQEELRQLIKESPIPGFSDYHVYVLGLQGWVEWIKNFKGENDELTREYRAEIRKKDNSKSLIVGSD